MRLFEGERAQRVHDCPIHWSLTALTVPPCQRRPPHRIRTLRRRNASPPRLTAQPGAGDEPCPALQPCRCRVGRACGVAPGPRVLSLGLERSCRAFSGCLCFGSCGPVAWVHRVGPLRRVESGDGLAGQRDSRAHTDFPGSGSRAGVLHSGIESKIKVVLPGFGPQRELFR